MKNTNEFIESLQLPKELASVVLTTVEDCQSFYIGFYGRNSYTIDDLLDYRERKLSISDIELDTFISMCNNIGRLETFRQTFLQPISESDMSLIDKAIENGKVTLEGIYNSFQENVNKNILQNVL